MKEFSSFQPSRFYPCPSGRDNFRAVRILDILKFYLALCLQNLWFISLKKLVTFGCCVRFSPTEIQAYFLRILSWSAKESKNPFTVPPITRGKVMAVSPRRERGRGAVERILGEGVWCLSEIKESSVKTKACDC